MGCDTRVVLAAPDQVRMSYVHGDAYTCVQSNADSPEPPERARPPYGRAGARDQAFEPALELGEGAGIGSEGVSGQI